MPWLMIWMSAASWQKIQKKAKERGYPYPRARERELRDLFGWIIDHEYLFTSGVPQSVVLDILEKIGGYEIRDPMDRRNWE